MGPIFIVRQRNDARYSYRLDVRLSVRLSVRPSHAGIVSKRLNLSSNCLHSLVADSSFLRTKIFPGIPIGTPQQRR